MIRIGEHPEPAELQRYADGEIAPDRDQSLLNHVAACSECSAEVERLRRLSAALALTSAPPSGVDLFERVKARRASGERVLLPVPVVPDQVVQRHFARATRSWRWSALAAAALIVAAVGLVWYPRVEHEPTVARGGTLGDTSSVLGWRALSPAARERRWLEVKRAMTEVAQASVAERGDSLIAPLAGDAFRDDSASSATQESLQRLGIFLRTRPEFRVLVLGGGPKTPDPIASMRLRLRLYAARDAIARGGVDSSRLGVAVVADSAAPPRVAIVVLRPAPSLGDRAPR